MLLLWASSLPAQTTYYYTWGGAETGPQSALTETDNTSDNLWAIRSGGCTEGSLIAQFLEAVDGTETCPDLALTIPRGSIDAGSYGVYQINSTGADFKYHCNVNGNVRGEYRNSDIMDEWKLIGMGRSDADTDIIVNAHHEQGSASNGRTRLDAVKIVRMDDFYYIWGGDETSPQDVLSWDWIGPPSYDMRYQVRDDLPLDDPEIYAHEGNLPLVFLELDLIESQYDGQSGTTPDLVMTIPGDSVPAGTYSLLAYNGGLGYWGYEIRTPGDYSTKSEFVSAFATPRLPEDEAADFEWLSEYAEWVIYTASGFLENPYYPGETFLTIVPDAGWGYGRVYYADYFDAIYSRLVPHELIRQTVGDYLIPRYPEKWLGLREEGWYVDPNLPPAGKEGWTEENPQFNVKAVYLHYKLSGSTEIFVEHEETIRRYILEHPGYFTQANGIIYFSEDEVLSITKRGYGFYDVVPSVGYNLFATLLLWEAYEEMAELYSATGNPERYGEFKVLADQIKENLLGVFWNEEEELLFSATEINRQSDIWGSAFAVSIGILPDEYADKVSHSLERVYDDVVWRGQIRHMIESGGWESALVGVNWYQNGGYWGTATGWFVKALHRTNSALALQTARDAIDDYRNRCAYEFVHPTGAANLCHYVSNVGLLVGTLIDLGYMEPRVSDLWDGGPDQPSMEGWITINETGDPGWMECGIFSHEGSADIVIESRPRNVHHTDRYWMWAVRLVPEPSLTATTDITHAFWELY